MGEWTMPDDVHESDDASPSQDSPAEGSLELEAPAPTAAPVRQAPSAPPAEPVLPEPRRWSPFLVEAWRFPLRKGVLGPLLPWALLHLVACALLGMLLNSLAASMEEMPILPHFGFFLTLVTVAGVDGLMFSTLAWWELHVVNCSAWDPEQPVHLPQFDSVEESIVHPGGLMLAAILSAAIPLALGYALKVTLLRTWQWSYWLPVAGALCSAVLLPGTILSVAVAETASAANPLNALRAFFAMPGRYLVACALGLPAAALTVVVVASVLSWSGAGWVIIPIAEFAWLLVLTANARILGALFWSHGEHMGWLKELKREQPIPSRRPTARGPADTDHNDPGTAE
jgi:hypothetical protein